MPIPKNHYLRSLELLLDYSDCYWALSDPLICQHFAGSVVALWHKQVLGAGDTSFAALKAARDHPDHPLGPILLPTVLVPSISSLPNRPP